MFLAVMSTRPGIWRSIGVTSMMATISMIRWFHVSVDVTRLKWRDTIIVRHRNDARSSHWYRRGFPVDGMMTIFSIITMMHRTHAGGFAAYKLIILPSSLKA